MSQVQATAQDIRDFAEEFSDRTDTKLELYLEYARNWVHETKWGRKGKLAEILMACHLLTVNERQGGAGASGPVTSESVGDVSIGYANTTVPGDEELSSTGYGVQFLHLRKTLLITPIVV